MLHDVTCQKPESSLTIVRMTCTAVRSAPKAHVQLWLWQPLAAGTRDWHQQFLANKRFSHFFPDHIA